MTPTSGRDEVSIPRRVRRLAAILLSETMAERAHAFQQRQRSALGLSALAVGYAGVRGTRVVGGPFRGLVYPQDRIGLIDAPIAKLLGTYEMELREVLEHAVTLRPALFIDVGCADGYYAVGMALSSPTTVVHAFDLAPSARKGVRLLASANGVENRVIVHGGATSRSLARLVDGPAVILSDCEGAEKSIFAGRAVPALAQSLVIVELHEWAGVDPDRDLVDRFAATHTHRFITARGRRGAEHSELRDLAPSDQRLAVEEFRQAGQRWLVLSPRTKVSPNSDPQPSDGPRAFGTQRSRHGNTYRGPDGASRKRFRGSEALPS